MSIILAVVWTAVVMGIGCVIGFLYGTKRGADILEDSEVGYLCEPEIELIRNFKAR